jgi:hypothetical protein
MMLPFRSGAGTIAAPNLLRNPEPKTDSPAKGRSATPVRALPLIVFISSPWTTAMNRSVVGYVEKGNYIEEAYRGVETVQRERISVLYDAVSDNTSGPM